ncbi:MAG: hypothetical protein KA140_02700 [Caldisericia bacterium]|nr:hypothetical protein [Caldisericia bacterium]
MNRFWLLLIIAVMTSSCGGSATQYIEGSKDFTGEIGKIVDIPNQSDLREMGDSLQEYMLEFNFKSGISGQLNPLTQEQTDYIFDAQKYAGTPQINPDYKAPGKVEIVFSNGSIAKLDKVTLKFTALELTSNAVPPADIEYSGERREMTAELAEKIARFWFDRYNFDLKNFQLNPITVGQSTSVVFTEKLADSDVASPNYIKAVINYWGMIEGFEINVGPTPTIGTKPTLGETGIKDKAKQFLALPTDFELNVIPVRVIKRIYKEENGKLTFTDKLAWFIDASGYKIESRNQILTLDAHTGMPIQ